MVFLKINSKILNVYYYFLGNNNNKGILFYFIFESRVYYNYFLKQGYIIMKNNKE
jgi:hypothetical protein